MGLCALESFLAGALLPFTFTHGMAPIAPLVFVHVPKTAGSTMLALLERQYPPDAIFKTSADDIPGSLSSFRGLSASERGRLKLIMGHCVLPLADMISNEARYITFLRHPVEQFVSSFHYIRRATWNRSHEQVRSLANLEEFLEYWVADGSDNQQTRHLSGVLEAMGLDGPKTGAVIPVDDALFAKACHWLGRMDNVGLTEHFDASMLLMRKGANWPHPVFYRVLNKTHKRPKEELTPAFLKHFEKVYQWDFALYRMAIERFERDVKEEGATFQKEIERFQRGNAWRQRLRRTFSL